MTYRIEDLKGEISKGQGIAKANIYRVFLPPITGISTKSLDALCRSVNMPGKQILTSEKVIGTISQKIPWGFANDDVNMSFIGLNDFGVRRYFEAWHRMIINHNAGHTVNYKNTFERDVTIEHVDSLNNVQYSITLLGAYPVQLLDIGYSAEPGSQVNIGVSLTYTRWIWNPSKSKHTRFESAD